MPKFSKIYKFPAFRVFLLSYGASSKRQKGEEMLVLKVFGVYVEFKLIYISYLGKVFDGLTDKTQSFQRFKNL